MLEAASALLVVTLASPAFGTPWGLWRLVLAASFILLAGLASVRPRASLAASWWILLMTMLSDAVIRGILGAASGNLGVLASPETGGLKFLPDVFPVGWISANAAVFFSITITVLTLALLAYTVATAFRRMKLSNSPMRMSFSVQRDSKCGLMKDNGHSAGGRSADSANIRPATTDRFWNRTAQVSMTLASGLKTGFLGDRKLINLCALLIAGIGWLRPEELLIGIAFYLIVCLTADRQGTRVLFSVNNAPFGFLIGASGMILANMYIFA